MGGFFIGTLGFSDCREKMISDWFGGGAMFFSYYEWSVYENIFSSLKSKIIYVECIDGKVFKYALVLIKKVNGEYCDNR